jgi:hypothetical protein
MSNLVKFSGTGLATRDDLARSLNNVAMAAPAVGGDKQFLKMDKGNGDWMYGQDEAIISPKSLWAVNPHSFAYGYIAWDTDSGGAPVQEIMVPVNRPLPAQNALPAALDSKGNALGYQFQQSVDMVCVLDPDGDDKDSDLGVEVQYKQSSVGAMKAFKSLTNAVAAQLQKGSDAIVPIVKITADSYKHKKYGKIFNPIFEIVEWRKMDDTSPVGADEVDEAEAPEIPAEGSAAEEDALAAEYAREEAAKAAAAQTTTAAGAETPRRRVRR